MPKPDGGFAQVNEGWQIHLNRGGKWPGLPADSYAALGGGAKSFIFVSPGHDIVIARNGRDLAKSDQIEELVEPILNAARSTTVSIAGSKWRLGGEVTYRGTKAEGLLMNARMVNAVFEDRGRPDFDAEANTESFIARIPDYVAHGVRAFTLSLQGGDPDYEGAVNSAFDPDGSLRPAYLARVQRVVEASDRHGAVVILGCTYQRQDQILRDDRALRAGVANIARWIAANGFRNVVLEIANEFGHKGFDHRLLKTAAGQVELIRLANAMGGTPRTAWVCPRAIWRASPTACCAAGGGRTDR